MQRAFLKPRIIFNAVFFKVIVQSLNIQRQRIIAKRLTACFAVAIYIFVAVNLGERLCVIDYILAEICVLGNLNRIVKQLQISCLKACLKLLNLIARVIDVKLTRYIKSRSVEHRAESVAECAASCIAYMHGACGVCRNIFNQNALAIAEVGFTVSLAAVEHVVYNLAVITVGKSEIDKAGACNLNRA